MAKDFPRVGCGHSLQTVLKTAKDQSVLINLVGLMTPDCSNNPRLGNQVNVIGSINVFAFLQDP